LPLRKGLKKVEEGFLRLLHLDDSAHRIALGVAVGIFVAMTPTWGIQMLLVVGLAWLVGANKVAGIPVVWVTNPATNVPIYTFCYLVGRAMVGGPSVNEIREGLAAFANPPLGWWMLAKAWADLMWDAALPLWVGCLAVGAGAGVMTYVILYYLITAYRRHHQHHLAALAADGQPPGGTATHSEAAAKATERPCEPGSGKP